MPIWVLIVEADWLSEISLTSYQSFAEAAYAAAWMSMAAERRGSTFTVVEAEVSSGAPVQPRRCWPSGPWERNRDT